MSLTNIHTTIKYKLHAAPIGTGIMYDVTWGAEEMPQWDGVLWEQRKCSRLENVSALDVSKDHSDPYWTGQISKLQVTGSLMAEGGE